MTKKISATVVFFLLTAVAVAQNATPNARPRVSDLGLKVGVLPLGRSMRSPMLRASGSGTRPSSVVTTCTLE